MSAEPLTASPAADTGAVDAENPWPGLAAFREADQEFFHGRDLEIEELLRLVLRDRLTLLFGLSGLGKTSLLQAGLFPRLRKEDVLPVRIRLDFSEEHLPLIEQVKAEILREAMARGVEAPVLRPSETLWELFHRQGSEFWSSRNRIVAPLLVFDQFEEIFTFGREDAETDTFVREIAALCEGAPPQEVRARLDEDPAEARTFSFNRHPYRILLSLREDFLPDLEELRGRIRSIGSNRLRLYRMHGENALRVVTRAGGRLIAPDAAERVVRFVAGRPEEDSAPLEDLEVEPALLSVVCRELNNKRRAEGASQITADLLQGNRNQILSRFYRRSVEDLDARVRTFIEESLITPSGFRDSVALENALGRPGITREAIDTLTDRRLLRIEDRGGVERLELTHDVLTRVIRASRDSRREKEAREEAESARAEAEEREQKARNELKRQNRILLLVSLLLAAVVILGLWGYVEQRAGRKARSISDLGVAASLRDSQSNKALAYLARALRTNPDNVAARTWITDLLLRRTWPVPVLEVREEDGFVSAELSPDGQSLLTATRTGKVQTWDARTGQLSGSPISGLEGLLGARLSPDGTRIVTRATSATRIWESGTGKPVVSLAGYASEGHIDFGPDGSILMMSDTDIRFLDSRDGRFLASGPTASFPYTLARFSPDGRHLLTVERWWDKNDVVSTLWDVAPGGIRKKLTLPFSWNIANASFNQNGSLLAIASPEGTGQVLDVASGQPVGEPFDHDAPINSIGFSPKDDKIVTASEDRTARVWDARTGRPVTEPLQHSNAVRTASFSPDGRRIVTASSDGTARLWEIQTGRSGSELLQVGNQAILSRDGSRVASASGRQTSVQELPSGRILGPSIELPQTMVGLQLSPDGNHVVTLENAILNSKGLHMQARLWKVETGRATGKPFSVEGFLDFSDDMEKFATINPVTESTLKVVDLQTGRTLLEGLLFYNVSFSPDGQSIVFPTTPLALQLWSFKKAAPIGKPLRHPSRITSLSFSADSRLLVTAAADQRIRIWDARSGAFVSEFGVGSGFDIIRVQFSPGRSFLLASGHGRVSAFETSGKILGTRLLVGPPESNGISQDEEVAATSMYNGFYLWQPKTGELLADPFKESQHLENPRLRPDGRIFYAITKDFLGASVHAWELSAGTGEDVETLAKLAETAGGFRLDKDGRLASVENWLAQIQELRNLTSDDLDDPLSAAALARWFFADRFTRTLSPLSRITVPDYIRHRLARGTDEARSEVFKAYPDHPLVLEELRRVQSSPSPPPE